MITCSTEVQNILMPYDRIIDNVQTFGEYEAAKIAKKTTPFSIYYHLRFNRSPRSRASGLPVSSKK